MLKEDAKRQCDYLIAVLQTDPQLTAQEKTDRYNQWWNVTYNSNATAMK
jgi:hypothetical protein